MKIDLLKYFQRKPKEEIFTQYHGKIEGHNIDVAPTQEFREHLEAKGLYLTEEHNKEIDELFPKRAHSTDAGYDLKAFIPEPNENGNFAVTIAPGDTKLIKTGFKWAIPDGYVGKVCSRSGLALKYGVIVLNSPGIVDSSYRGDVGVVLHNVGKNPVIISHGDKIAQMVVQKHADDLVIHSVFDLVDNTVRGKNGFGSTGK